MRIYNGTNSQLDLPLSSIQRISIPAHSVSGDILPNTEFLSLLVTSFEYNEIALIVSGPYEINMCSGVPGAVGFVVQSVEEAIEKFTPKQAEEKIVCGCCKKEPCECSNNSTDMTDEKEAPICCCEEEAVASVEKKKKSKKKDEEVNNEVSNND